MKHMLMIYASEANESTMKPADIQGLMQAYGPTPRHSRKPAH